MRRKTRAENINFTPKGIQFTFDTESEAKEFFQECQDKLTAAEIENNKVILLIPTKTGETNSPV